MLEDICSALSFIGMATACSQKINILIIIRSLSLDFYNSANRQNYSIPLDRTFLLALDGGLAMAGGVVIESYMLDWWNGTDITHVTQLLNIGSIENCLDFHKEQIKIANEFWMDSGSNGDSGIASKNGLLKPVYIWKSNASKPISDQDNFHRCRLYRAVTLVAHDENSDIRNIIQGTEVSLKA